MVGEKFDNRVKRSSRSDGIIPVSVKIVALEADRSHLFLGDNNAFRVFSRVELDADAKTGPRPC